MKILQSFECRVIDKNTGAVELLDITNNDDYFTEWGIFDFNKLEFEIKSDGQLFIWNIIELDNNEIINEFKSVEIIFTKEMLDNANKQSKLFKEIEWV